MNENNYVAIITELANQLASKAINEAEFKVRLTESQQLVAQLAQEVESYRNTIESNAELKALFEKIKNNKEVTN
jgi:hypothetical protein|nr:MAG TPA: hypothetical protein [Caudoviricetes sp.]